MLQYISGSKPALTINPKLNYKGAKDMKKTKLLGLVLIFVLKITTASAVFAILLSAAIYSGTCGKNVYWSLNTETGVLDITGSGAMVNCSSSTSAPWHSNRDNGELFGNALPPEN